MSFIIGITGASGAGKTTFLKRLMDGFTPEQVCLVSQDNYYCPREQQEKDALGIENFDRPESINREAFVHDVKKLMAGETVSIEEYVFNNKNTTPNILSFTPAPVIIVEGLFVFHYLELRELLDLKVFLHASPHISLIRRIKRDGMERNYPIDDVLYRYEHHVQPAFERYIQPYRDEADIIINNNVNFDQSLSVLKAFIAQKSSAQ